MLHELRLNIEPFNSIKSGTKTVEMRLYDEKRKRIKIGDKINFLLRSDMSKSIMVEVVGLRAFNNFAELYKSYNKIELGYKEDEIADPKDMQKYYSLKEQKLYGVVAIKVKLI